MLSAGLASSCSYKLPLLLLLLLLKLLLLLLMGPVAVGISCGMSGMLCASASSTAANMSMSPAAPRYADASSPDGGNSIIESTNVSKSSLSCCVWHWAGENIFCACVWHGSFCAVDRRLWADRCLLIIANAYLVHCKNPDWLMSTGTNQITQVIETVYGKPALLIGSGG